MRLEKKERTKGHIYRRYQEAKTPYQWLVDSPAVPAEVKEKLITTYNTLNPAELKRTIDAKLATLLKVYEAKHQVATETVEPKVPEREPAFTVILELPNELCPVS